MAYDIDQEFEIGWTRKLYFQLGARTLSEYCRKVRRLGCSKEFLAPDKVDALADPGGGLRH